MVVLKQLDAEILTVNMSLERQNPQTPSAEILRAVWIIRRSMFGGG